MLRSFLYSTGALSASRVFLAASQVLVLPVIARHLTVEEFALVALAMSVVIFTQVLSDAGFGRSLIRTESYDVVEWSSVFWLLVAVGAGLAAALTVVAPVWAWAFESPRLAPLVTALAVVPFLQAVAAVPNAELERRERFPLIAAVNTISTALGLAAAVLLAIAGAGAWALVAQQILVALGRCSAVFALSRFRPRPQFERAGLASHVLFARDSLAVSLIFTVQTQAPTILIGRLLGVAPLGLFAMAQRLLRLPQLGLGGPASQVVYVRMARARNDPVRMGALYVAATRLLALAVLPPMALLAAMGGTLIPWVLSDDWAGVARVFALAAPGYALETATATASALFLASGRTALRVRMALERAVLRVATIAAATPFGLEAAAFSITLFAAAYLPRYWAYARRCAPFDARAAASAVLAPAVASALAWTAFAGWRSVASPGEGGEIAVGTVALLSAWTLAGASQWRALRRDLALFRT